LFFNDCDRTLIGPSYLEWGKNLYYYHINQFCLTSLQRHTTCIVDCSLLKVKMAKLELFLIYLSISLLFSVWQTSAALSLEDQVKRLTENYVSLA
jgi:hypothetical protein